MEGTTFWSHTRSLLQSRFILFITVVCAFSSFEGFFSIKNEFFYNDKFVNIAEFKSAGS